MAGIRKLSAVRMKFAAIDFRRTETNSDSPKHLKLELRQNALRAELDISAEERSSSITLAALIDEYISEVTSQKRSKRTEEIRLRRLQRDKLAAKTLSSFTNRTIENYIERRLSER